ncbi:MAG: DUF1700 domain-containing protein [Clostridiales bacterium]|nr:DUF1700 domain-containing protein [Clostridiales bacterium]
MNKEEFLNELRQKLSGLPKEDLEERISFYREIIEDHMEDGVTEEEAVASIGSVDSVVEQIMSEIPLTKLVKQKVKPKNKLKTWQIVLIAVGSIVWVPLLIAFLAVALALYIVIWALVIWVYAIDLSCALSAIGCLGSIAQYAASGNAAGVLYSIAAALVMAGLAILLFFASIAVTKGVIKLTGKILLGIKTSFVGKENKR